MQVIIVVILFSLVLSSYPQNIMLQDITIDSVINSKELIPISDSTLIEEMNFKSADIRDVLRGIGSQYNLNIWLTPEVEGRIPISFKNIPVKTALDFIITKYGYQYVVKNGIIEVTVLSHEKEILRIP